LKLPVWNKTPGVFIVCLFLLADAIQGLQSVWSDCPQPKLRSPIFTIFVMGTYYFSLHAYHLHISLLLQRWRVPACLSSTTTSAQRPQDSKIIYSGDKKTYFIAAQVVLGAAVLTNTFDLAVLTYQNAPGIWEYMFNADMFLETDPRLWVSLLRWSVIYPLYFASYLLSQRTFNKIYFSDKEKLFAGERLTWYLCSQYVLFKPKSATPLTPHNNIFKVFKGNLEIGGKQFIVDENKFKSVPRYHLMFNKKESENES
jgi:hypothetical protein